jgi:hypothetical protein
MAVVPTYRLEGERGTDSQRRQPAETERGGARLTRSSRRAWAVGPLF